MFETHEGQVSALGGAAAGDPMEQNETSVSQI